MNRSIFVTGIGTEVGKTLAAAAICRQTGWPYWKPVQTGTGEGAGDTEFVAASLGERLASPFKAPAYSFAAPLSPHAAAAMEGREIDLATILAQVPTGGPCVIEGAGGVWVPLNAKETMLDLMLALQARVVVISRNYLGSINHTLLTIVALRQAGIDPLGVIFNGESTPASEEAILGLGRIRCIGRMPVLPAVNAAALDGIERFDL